MSNTSKILAKGNVESNYAKMAMELYDYIQLGLISHTDVIVYMKLYDLVNIEQGYAFPTVLQLMTYTRIGGKATIHSSLKTLVKVGLIDKSKTKWGNNTYFVYKPLEKEELYKRYPENVRQFKKFESKLMKTADHDKERYQLHQQNKQEQPEIQAKELVPKL